MSDHLSIIIYGFLNSTIGIFIGLKLKTYFDKKEREKEQVKYFKVDLDTIRNRTLTIEYQLKDILYIVNRLEKNSLNVSRASE